ncbi:hypothetical protein RDWZM_004205 [Blomia tropicalis]|uniref:Large ribosomal subunit protein mL38 n=1 Tax=Blomia tropicalis TaxID=40697 RepID=A0A9Q0MGN7_BLOTA|nr:hypothetical protein RDWZM_004205 [Blomia tropicalis]
MSKLFKFCKQTLQPNASPNWNHLSRISVHNSSIYNRRRGPVSEVQLPDLIINKPPNYYPTLQQKLDRINYFEKFTTGVNIENEIDDIELDNETVAASLNDDQYRKLAQLCTITNEYIQSTVELAHHYAIFRDLFFREPFKPETNSELIAANARNEKIDFTRQATYYFMPIVPIDAEFYLEQEDNDDISCLTAYRGNLIPSEYGSKPPKVSINTSLINGQSESPFTSSSDNASILLNSGKEVDKNFYTLVLVNLDSHFEDSGVCHWMLSNITNNGGKTEYQTIFDYLPIYGINGLGYHRYSFVLFRHNKPLNSLNQVSDFDLSKRKFNCLQFLDSHLSNDTELELKPVGLSWFQTTWDHSSNKIFYDYLNMRSPIYEFDFPKETKYNELQFPGRAPFNLYLDHFRDSKELSKEVLLERLKTIEPLKSYEPDKMYRSWNGRPILPHIHPIPHGTPDWQKSTVRNKRSHLGRFRGMRPVSAILPHNNNADLDNPKWPRISPDVLPLNCPNPYPDGHRRPKPLRTTLWTKPLPEHHSTRIAHEENLPEIDRKNLENKPQLSD